MSMSTDTGLNQIYVPQPNCTASFQTHCIICHDLISRTLTYAYWYVLLRPHGPLLQENERWAESCDPAMCHTRNARDYVVHCLSVTKEMQVLIILVTVIKKR
jgi:hypothetical protein